MLELQALSVAYGSTTVVDGVNLRVEDGSVLAVLGPSGCGKSSLLRAVAGLEPPAGGRVCWDGIDLTRIPVHRRGFGLMFQEGALFPHRTVAGNVAYGLDVAGVARKQVAARTRELLDLVGLAGLGDRSIGTLSGGQAQRVALARALAPGPRLLLLDEPLASLDRSLRERLLDDLRAVLRSTGTTALFVTHDQSEAFAIADTVALMDAGRIRQTGSPRQVWDEPVDEWVARFVGYDTILAGTSVSDSTGRPGIRTALGTFAGIGSRVALCPESLVVDPDGPVRGRCLAVVPAPQSLRLLVQIDGVGQVPAVADPAAATAVGDELRLRVDNGRVVVLGSGQERGRLRP